MVTGLTLNIGLNRVDPTHYQDANGDPWDGALEGCEFDAKDMNKLARVQGLDGPILLNEEATSEAVAKAIRDASDRLEPGDLFLLTYSGHGGQLTDYDGDEPIDRRDETWVLYDRELLDDELFALWSGFKPGVRIVVLSDSCHSGSVTRNARAAYVARIDAVAKTRDLPRGVQAGTYRAHKALYDGIQAAHPAGDRAALGAHVLLISGCQDNQLSLDGTGNGLFTGTLLQVWQDGAFEGDYAALRAAIVDLMPESQQPNLSLLDPRSQPFEQQKPFSV